MNRLRRRCQSGRRLAVESSDRWQKRLQKAQLSGGKAVPQSRDQRVEPPSTRYGVPGDASHQLELSGLFRFR